MRKAIVALILIAVLCGGVTAASATGIVHDPLNYATNLINNALVKAQHVLDLVEAGKRLVELKNLVSEFESFTDELIDSGYGEIQGAIEKFGFLTGGQGFLKPYDQEFSNAYLEVLNQNPYFQGTSLQLEQIDFLSNQTGIRTSTLPYYLTLVPDPLSPNHKYITYEQAQVAETFKEAEDLHEYAKELAEDGEEFASEAAGANLLGATRLQAAATGKLLEAFAVLLEAQGRISKMEAISVEQVSREEKAAELARRKVADDIDEFLGNGTNSFLEGSRL